MRSSLLINQKDNLDSLNKWISNDELVIFRRENFYCFFEKIYIKLWIKIYHRLEEHMKFEHNHDFLKTFNSFKIRFRIKYYKNII